MSETGATPEPPRTGPVSEPPASPPVSPPVPPAAPTPASPAAQEQPAAPAEDREPGGDTLRGRTSGLWTAVVALVVLLVLLAVFVFQNTQQVRVTYFGWEVEAPLSAALLVATAAGGLIVVAAGSLRILQLRRRVRRETKLRRAGWGR